MLLMARMMRPGGIHIIYVVSLIKINIFSIFTQKCEKLHYALWQLLRAITAGTFEDTCTLFAPNWGFLGSTNRMVSFKFTPD